MRAHLLDSDVPLIEGQDQTSLEHQLKQSLDQLGVKKEHVPA